MHGDVRRINLRQFRDWSLWFRVLADNSVIVACLSNRMNPRLLKKGRSGFFLFGANLKAMWADLPGQLPLDDPHTQANILIELRLSGTERINSAKCYKFIGTLSCDVLFAV